MKEKNLDEAVAEAKRFIDKAHAYKLTKATNNTSYQSNPKEQGAVKRSSMDLTRALSKLRNDKE